MHRKAGAVMVALCIASPSWALPERTVSFDLGVGIPELLAAHTQVQAMPRLQVGLGYTYLPSSLGVLGQSMSLPGRDITLVDGRTYTTTPEVVPTASFLTPFVRFFPREDNFYFQISYSLARIFGHATSGLTDSLTGTELIGAAVEADITVTQHIPTVGIGYIFSGKVYFWNVFLGAAWFGGLTTSVAVTSNLPDSVGGAIANDPAIQEFKDELQTNADTTVRQLRSQYPILPSIHVSFGFFI